MYVSNFVSCWHVSLFNLSDQIKRRVYSTKACATQCLDHSHCLFPCRKEVGPGHIGSMCSADFRITICWWKEKKQKTTQIVTSYLCLKTKMWKPLEDFLFTLQLIPHLCFVDHLQWIHSASWWIWLHNLKSMRSRAETTDQQKIKTKQHVL